MILDRRVVILTLRPEQEAGTPDLEVLAQELTVERNSARVTHYDSQPAITAIVRVRSSRLAARIVAQQWVRDRLAGIPVEILRSFQPGRPAPRDVHLVHLTESAGANESAVGRSLREMGAKDVRHTVVVRSSALRSDGRVALNDDVDLDPAALRLLGARRSMAPESIPSGSKMAMIRRGLGGVLSMLGPVLTAATTVRSWPQGWWFLFPLMLLVGGLCSWYVARTFFTNESRSLLTRWAAALLLVLGFCVFGILVGANDDLPSLREVARIAVLAPIVLLVGFGVALAALQHQSLRRPWVMAASLVGPAMAGGAALWSWSAADGWGIPSGALGLTWWEQIWMVWPVMRGSLAAMLILVSVYGWIRYAGLWDSEVLLWKVMAPLVVLIYLLSALTAGMEDVQEQTADTNKSLLERHGATGVLQTRITWACVVVNHGATSYGGKPIKNSADPVVHFKTDDGRVWLWDPRQEPEKRAQAVAYVPEQVRIEFVDSGHAACRNK